MIFWDKQPVPDVGCLQHNGFKLTKECDSTSWYQYIWSSLLRLRSVLFNQEYKTLLASGQQTWTGIAILYKDFLGFLNLKPFLTD